MISLNLISIRYYFFLIKQKLSDSDQLVLLKSHFSPTSHVLLSTIHLSFAANLTLISGSCSGCEGPVSFHCPLFLSSTWAQRGSLKGRETHSSCLNKYVILKLGVTWTRNKYFFSKWKISGDQLYSVSFSRSRTTC